MAVLECDVGTLLDLSKCLLCLSETELLAAEVLVLEQFYADGASTTPRTLDQLLAASEVWSRLSDYERLAIEVRQLCNSAVIVGARTSCEADALRAEIACYCQAPKSKLESVISYLRCLQRQT
jgi:hypothetical protein